MLPVSSVSKSQWTTPQTRNHCFFYLKKKNYLFVFACTGSSRASSSCREQGYSSFRCMEREALRWLLLLQHTSSRVCGLQYLWYRGFSCKLLSNTARNSKIEEGWRWGMVSSKRPAGRQVPGSGCLIVTLVDLSSSEVGLIWFCLISI